MPKEKYISIHGHFYQPPRENPWKNKIDVQESAYPFHNWNQRINRECYHPNGFSRILDEAGRIKEIVCNYKYINFNIGPTLLDWIFEHDNILYKKILEADKQSKEIFGGHGNAIAQVYNHIIMPLAIKKDQITQINWGIAHFKHHFKRMPEAMWLAETAVNNETLSYLVDYGMKYVLLSPTQVNKVRHFNEEDWHDVGNTNVDTTKPYRIFLCKNKKKYIDVFFYNKDLSTGVSFSHYLKDAGFLTARFEEQFDNNDDNPQIVTACTDGESYGHHEHFGDMCLAYFLYKIVRQRGYKIANFGQYLEMYAPENEAVLKTGDNNEGTSWSCAHGVGRWIRDCGCHTGGHMGWNQKWRGPLREACDYLRDTVSVLYEEKLNTFFDDVWDIRDKYIEVILDYKEQAREKFLKKYCKVAISDKDKIMIFSFLEAQKNILLSYTSCAWFFSDISGIETAQNMKYAQKAIELIEPYTKIKFKENFLARLKKGKSNLEEPYPENGKEIFHKYVEPDIILQKDISANYAIACVLKNAKTQMNIFYYSVKLLQDKKTKDEHIMELSVKDNFIGLENIYYVYIKYDNLKNINCYVVSSDEAQKNKIDIKKSLKEIQKYSFLKQKCKKYKLSDLILNNREDIIKIAMKEKFAVIDNFVSKLYRDNKDLVDLFSSNNVDLPPIVRDISSYYLTKKINKKIELSKSIDISDIKKQFTYAKKIRVKVDRKKIEDTLYKVILDEIENISSQESIPCCNKLIELLKFKYSMNIELPMYVFEEKVFLLLYGKKYNKKGKFYKKLLELAGYLNIVV